MSPSFFIVAGVPDKFQVLLFSNGAHERLSLLFPERNSINFSEVSKPIQWLALGRQINYGPVISYFSYMSIGIIKNVKVVVSGMENGSFHFFSQAS